MATTFRGLFGQSARSHLDMCEPGERMHIPLCGAMNTAGTGFARTNYTTDPSAVTCKRCLAGMSKRGWLFNYDNFVAEAA